jgi:Predicted membrane protein
MLHLFSETARTVIEFLSILIILGGVLVACYRMAVLGLTRWNKGRCPAHLPHVEGDSMIKLRLSFERTLMLGLQFLMAADIVGTITDPDLQGVLVLAVIVLLRIALSFTLSREVAEIDRQKKESDSPVCSK